MQQTTKYQFNLVDTTDDFSPTPLNQNMEKVEEELEGIEESLADVVSGLGTGGHNARIAWGSYTGTGTYGASNPTSLTFDFAPAAVLIRTANGRYSTVFIRGCTTSHACINDSLNLQVGWTNDEVSWYSTDAPNTQNNSSGTTYYYVAVGYSA